MAHTLTGTLQGKTITLDSSPPQADEAVPQRVQVELAPLDAEADIPPELLELVRCGKARKGARNNPDSYPRLSPILKQGTAQELLDEERGDR